GAAKSSCYQFDQKCVRFSTRVVAQQIIPPNQMKFLLNSKWHDNLSLSDYLALLSTRLRELLVIPEKPKTDPGECAAAIQVPLHAGKDLHANIRQITKWCRALIISLPWTTWNAPATNITQRLIPDLHCDLVWMVNNNNMEMIATTKTIVQVHPSQK
ncbi:hypothetical protein PHMEG_00024095, partial [Phytophthora megakarya]